MKAQVLAGGRGLGTFTNGFQGGVHIVTRHGLLAHVAHAHAAQLYARTYTRAQGDALMPITALVHVSCAVPPLVCLHALACLTGRH